MCHEAEEHVSTASWYPLLLSPQSSQLRLYGDYTTRTPSEHVCYIVYIVKHRQSRLKKVIYNSLFHNFSAHIITQKGRISHFEVCYVTKTLITDILLHQ